MLDLWSLTVLVSKSIIYVALSSQVKNTGWP